MHEYSAGFFMHNLYIATKVFIFFHLMPFIYCVNAEHVHVC